MTTNIAGGRNCISIKAGYFPAASGYGWLVRATGTVALSGGERDRMWV